MNPERTVAIMQPYLFPYIGYFQLINVAAVFVLYDDVNFIKQGWISRNQVLNNNKPHLFSIPLESASSFKKICDTNLNRALIKNWYVKFEKLIESAYSRSPYYAEIMDLLQSILHGDHQTISDLNNASIKTICDYLEIKTVLKSAKVHYNNQHLSSQQRVIDICATEQADIYLNASGGRQLYSEQEFAKHNIQLRFIKPQLTEYPQFKNCFVPGLSIIDVLMFNGKEKSQALLSNYTVE